MYGRIRDFVAVVVVGDVFVVCARFGTAMIGMTFLFGLRDLALVGGEGRGRVSRSDGETQSCRFSSFSP